MTTGQVHGHHVDRAYPEGYPTHRVVDVPLRDGSTIRIRPALSDDLVDLTELFGRMSQRSRRFRFHGVVSVTADSLRPFVDLDYRDTFGLVAETSAGDGPRIVALASYVRTEPEKAEMAIAIDDPFQGRGMGSILVEHLGEAAASCGIRHLVAEVLSENHDMLEVITSMSLPVEETRADGVVHIEFPSEMTAEAIEAFERREAIAAAAGVARFLEATSVAVIGASRRRGTISGEVFRNLLDADFNGPVYPVNPKAEVVQSVRAYPTIGDVPGDVDMAVIVVPSPAVVPIARQCGEKGVKSLLIISSGFAEVGDEGRDLQAELMEVARAFGMRVVGPNCMGLLNTSPEVRLDATFSPVRPGEGSIAFSSQSGALGIAVIDRANELGLGLSTFVSVGNKADISGNDLLQYWEQDDATDVILLYLESFGNPRKFARIARRVSRKKPIVAVKSGRSQAGARAAASHTGSMVAGDVAVDALFDQAGVIRTDALEEMFDVAALLANQPLPSGNKVGILTNAGGLGILCADACEAAGLVVPELSPKTIEAMRAMLPAEASVANPVDMIASASAEQYAATLKLLGADPRIDSIVIIFIPPLVTRPEDVAQALMDAARDLEGKTLLACFLGVNGIHEHLKDGELTIPSYSFPEDAGRALGAATRYAAWRRRPEGATWPEREVDRIATAKLSAELRARAEGWLDADVVAEVLDHYGIPSVRTIVAASADEVAEVASHMEGPVAVKLASRSIVHKSDLGGVRLGLASGDEARSAAEDIRARLEKEGLADQLDGFIVQQMGPKDAAEMFVGMSQDPLFGPLIAVGAGGTLVELLGDVSVRITPLTDVDVSEMLSSLRLYPLFKGYRGAAPLDEDALKELLLRLSVMVEDLPQLAELDLNPVLVATKGEGCMVVDARMRIARPEPPRPRGARTG